MTVEMNQLHDVNGSQEFFPVERTKSSVWEVVFGLVVVSVVVSQAMTNFLPSGLVNVAQASILIPYTASFILFAAHGSRDLWCLLASALFITFSIVVFVGSFGLDRTTSVLRYISGVMALFFVAMPCVTWFSIREMNVIRFFTIISSLFCSIYAFLGPPLVVGSPRLAVFTGGSDGLHPSAYATLGLVFLLISLGVPINRVGKVFYWVTGVLLLGALIGFDVRTAFVVAAVTCLSLWISSEGTFTRVMRVILVFVVPMAVGLIVLLLFFFADDLNNFSSGRTTNYVERIHIFLSRGSQTILFGSGPGTDLFYGSSAWRFEAKNSHNDVLTLLIETGLIGFLCVFGICAITLSRLRGLSFAILLGVLCSSLVSNGLLLRAPLAALYFFSIVIYDIRRRWST